MNKVQIGEGENPCWIWTAGRYGAGYGFIRVDGKKMGAHRASWLYFRGEIPEGLYVCHNCPGGDNKSCVNPDHLFLGSHSDNVVDAIHKGAFTSAKLTVEQVHAIREMREAGMSCPKIAKHFDVGYKTIHKIVTRRTWTHI